MTFKQQPLAYLMFAAVVGMVIVGMVMEMSVGEITAFVAIVTGAGAATWFQVTTVAKPQHADGDKLVPQYRRYGDR